MIGDVNMSKSQKLPQFVLERIFHKAGFLHKIPNYEMPEGAAQNGSYNFQIDDQGKWARRFGTKYLGTKSVDTGGCRNSAVLIRRDGVSIPIVQYGTKVKYLHPNTLDWAILLTGLDPAAVMGFAPSDLFDDNMNVEVMSNGVDAYQYWTGATGTVASTTANSITLNSSNTLAELGFTAAGDVVVLDGTPYTYTGISSQTFTGVTPDPSTLPVGEPLAQSTIVPDPSKTFKGNVLAATQYGRIVMGNVIKTGTISGNGSIFISQVDSYQDFTFSTPRVTGEGAIINAPNGGGSIKGIQPFEDGFVIAKDKIIYKLAIQDGDTIPFPLGVFVPHEGSVSPLCFFASGNTINYVTDDFTVSSLQRVAQFDQFAHPLPISDPIKATTDALFFDTTTAGLFYDGTDFYSMKTQPDAPVNNLILTLNKRYGVWNTPWQGLSASSFFIYGADLYMCDAATPNVYLMGSESVKIYNDFTTKEEPGFSIPGTLVLRANNYAAPAIKKEFTEYWIEGEMFLSDTVTFTASYDNGSKQVSGTLVGTAAGLIYQATGGFGAEEFGIDTFGQGSSGSQDENLPIRFRLILTSEIQSFYELTFKVDSTGYFRLITHGPKLIPSSEVPDDAIYKALS